MELNLTMLGRILHAVANELAAMEQETTVAETNDTSSVLVEDVPQEEDLSRFVDIESAFTFKPEQATPVGIDNQVEIKQQAAPQPVNDTDTRIAQLEEQLREARRQTSMANFNFQPININGETK